MNCSECEQHDNANRVPQLSHTPEEPEGSGKLGNAFMILTQNCAEALQKSCARTCNPEVIGRNTTVI